MGGKKTSPKVSRMLHKLLGESADHSVAIKAVDRLALDKADQPPCRQACRREG
jgi:hypothetical protein